MWNVNISKARSRRSTAGLRGLGDWGIGVYRLRVAMHRDSVRGPGIGSLPLLFAGTFREVSRVRRCAGAPGRKKMRMRDSGTAATAATMQHAGIGSSGHCAPAASRGVPNTLGDCRDLMAAAVVAVSLIEPCRRPHDHNIKPRGRQAQNALAKGEGDEV